MATLAVALLAIGLCGRSLAQGANGSQFLDGDDESWFRAGTPLPRNGILAVGAARVAGGTTVAIVRGSDSAGNTLFTTRVGPQNAVSSLFMGVARLPAGDYVATGWSRARGATHDDCLVSRIRPSGEVAWTRQVSGAGIQRCYFAVPRGSDDVIVGGRYEPEDDPAKPACGLLFAMRPDTGEVIAGSRHEIAANGARRSAFRSGVGLRDGSLVLGGWATDDTRQGDDAWVMRATRDLGSLWQWRWGENSDSIAVSVALSPTDQIVAVGTAGGPDRLPQALAAAIDMNGRLQWRRVSPVEGTVSSELQRVLVAPDQSITAVGWASDSKDGPPHALVLKFSKTGDRAQPALQRQFSESRAFDAVPSDQGLLILGSALRAGAAHSSGWIWNTATPAPLPAGVRPASAASLGEIADGAPGRISGHLATGQIAHYSFVASRRGPMQVAAIPQKGDVDLILRTDGGDVVRISDNGRAAAEFIAETLPAGRYDIEVTCNQDSAFVLNVSANPLPIPSADATALEQSWKLDDREHVEHALNLLGYNSSEGIGVFTATTRAEIQAFQAAVGQPPSGWLTESERLILAVKAAEAAVALSEAAARNAQKLTADSPASAVMSAAGGQDLVGHFGGNVILGVGRDVKLPSRIWYAGEWRKVPDSTDADPQYEPHGFGVFTDLTTKPPLQWAGEFEGWEVLKGLGASRYADGQTIYEGEWTLFESSSHRRGYGAQLINFNGTNFTQLPAGGFWDLSVSGKDTISVLVRPIPGLSGR
jgi:hypothetical protein